MEIVCGGVMKAQVKLRRRMRLGRRSMCWMLVGKSFVLDCCTLLTSFKREHGNTDNGRKRSKGLPNLSYPLQQIVGFWFSLEWALENIDT